LRERLSDYRGLARALAKWRAVIDMPRHPYRVRRRGERACAGALCGAVQENDIVPIVEPEVLMDGAHSIGRCEQVTEAVLASVFRQLFEHRVMLEGIVLKPTW